MRDNPCVATKYVNVTACKGTLPLTTEEGSQNTRGCAYEPSSPHSFASRERVTMQTIQDRFTAGNLPATAEES